MMESSTKETFAKPGYIKTHSIFFEHSLNKKGFRFQFQLNKHRQLITNNKQSSMTGTFYDLLRIFFFLPQFLGPSLVAHHAVAE